MGGGRHGTDTGPVWGLKYNHNQYAMHPKQISKAVVQAPSTRLSKALRFIFELTSMSRGTVTLVVVFAILACIVLLMDGKMIDGFDGDGGVQVSQNGGRDAKKGRYPYVCKITSIQEKGTATATGFLISPFLVVTAGHFARNNPDMKQMVVRIGAHNLTEKNDGSETRNVTRVTTVYDGKTAPTDWAILQLDRPSRKKPVLMDGFNANVTVKKGDTLFTVGWGLVGYPRLRTQILQDNALKITKVAPRLIHVSGENKVDGFTSEQRRSCKGDSGAPFFVHKDGKDIVVGILSRSIGSSKKNKEQLEQCMSIKGVTNVATRTINIPIPLDAKDIEGVITKAGCKYTGRIYSKTQKAYRCQWNDPWDAGVWDQTNHTPKGFKGKQSAHYAQCATLLNSLHLAHGARVHAPYYAL
jgi:V8-like Glu-specific endopeptidase